MERIPSLLVLAREGGFSGYPVLADREGGPGASIRESTHWRRDHTCLQQTPTAVPAESHLIL